MKKGFFKKTGALMLAATLTVSMVQVPVYGATTKTVTVSNQKQLNKALKVAKGKKAYSIIVKAGKNTKVTIPKENYKNVTIKVIGDKVTVKNNGTLKKIIINCSGNVSVKNNGTVKKVEVQKAKKVSLSGSSKKTVDVVISAKDTAITTSIAVKIKCTGENENVAVTNKTDKAIKVTDADGNTAKVKSGDKKQITADSKSDDKKSDDKNNDKTDDKDQTDNKDTTDEKKDENSSSGSTSGGSSSTDTFETTPSELAKKGYSFKWGDDFTGTSLKRSDWNVELHEPGWVNNELQAYVDSDENIQVKDGNLLLKPVKKTNADETESYTSGRINTQGKHDFKYGYFECRAKVPAGKGYLPAFWMMPADENLYGQWPKCGEIDIMEVMGQETNKAYGTIHYGEPHDQSQGTYTVSEKNNFADNYHTYACEWEPGKIIWYIDGVKFHEESDWFSAKSGQGEVTYPAPFDQPFYMILNLAVGGSWVGYPDATTTYDDQQFAIDYVKVYQKDRYDENVTKPVKNVTLRDNYINNGDFSVQEDLTDDVNWKFLTTLDGKGNAEIKDKKMVISTQNAGTADYSIQLVQPNVPLQKGGIYKVTFEAYADEARSMITDISGPDHNYTRYFADTKVDLGTEKHTYTYDFQMTGSDDANGRLEFNLGNTSPTAKVYLSNIRIEKTGYEEIKEDTTKKALADGNSDVTNLEDGRRLKVTSPAGTENGKVLVGQSDLALTAGTDYELSFRAQAEEAKQMKVTVAGQEKVFDLTTEEKNYSVKFKTAESLTDKNLSFDLGLGTTVYLDDVRIDEDSLIKNGSFNAGLAGFEAYCYTPSNVTYVVDSLNEDNAADFTINDTGDADWHIQLKQTGVKLEKGQWYRLSLKMKSSIDRNVSYALQRDGSTHKNTDGTEDWTPYCQKTVALTSEYQTITKEFQMTEDTDPDTIFNIAMGAVGGKQIKKQHRICIDDIVLEKIAAPEMKPEEAGKNLLKNGDFSNETDNWNIWGIKAPGEAKTDIADHAIVYHISNAGTEEWHVQLKQSGLTLEKGCKYLVTFKATSTAARTIKLAIMSTKYAWYGGADIQLSANNEKEVVCEFTMSKETDSNADFVISMGKINDEDTPASDITLSDFSLVKVDETTK